MVLKVKKISSQAVLPTRHHDDDAGIDLYSAEKKTIKSHQRQEIKSGVAIEIPSGHVGLVWDRSGLAKNHGLTVLAGVVDAGFRGEIVIIIYNTSDQDYEIKNGDRIAQLLLQKIEYAKIEEVKELSASKRGVNGWGSSGK